MSENAEPKEFDEATRDVIRRKILHYMQQHHIGVHKLAARIEQASRHKPEIPIKTLQRFLAGKIRTNDMYVGFFRQFAETLPDPDPVGELGRSMAEMYGVLAAFTTSPSSPVKRYAVLAEQDRVLSEITVAMDGKFSRLQETISGARHILYDGAMVKTGAAVLAMLKDRLTGLPKTYHLRFVPDGFEGQSLHTDTSGKQAVDQVKMVEGR